MYTRAEIKFSLTWTPAGRLEK